ncbi:MAG TPA: Hsp20/alpha crystallin family protein [Coleofasciculaceae cyanobacterium]|jgi:HSP20 family molecular chaperone IbpA
MSKRRGILLAVLAGLALLAVLVIGLVQRNSPEWEARQKLDDLLGQGTSELQPTSPFPERPDAGIHPMPEQLPKSPVQDPFQPPGRLFGFKLPLPKPAVDVTETPQAYELRVPLADPADESGIQLNVQPHRIEISGQSGSRKTGVNFSTSFMQSFSTRQEVLPDKITRRTEQKGEDTTLVITIPKKSPGTLSEPQPPSKIPNQPDLPEPAPLLNPDSIDEGQHTVI